MKKTISLLTFLVITLSLFVGVGSLQVEAAEYEWKFAHEEQIDGFMDSVAKEFKRLLAEKSDGRINIEIFPAGQLGNSKDMIELVRQGVVQFNFASTGHVGTMVPEAQGFLLHYIFPPNDKVVNEVLENGEAVEMIYDEFDGKGLKPLATLNSGWQIWTANKPIVSPEDFEGFKMRTMTSKLLLEDYAAYGANPTTTPYSEVYSSLQLKMIDGQVNPISCITNMKFYEVQDYLIKAYSNPFILTMITNPNMYNSLPEDIQEIVQESVSELYPYSTTWREQYNKEMEAKIIDEKPELEIITLSEEQRAEFKELAEPVQDTYVDLVGEDGEEFLKLIKEDIQEAEEKYAE
ncbi:MAG: DctP family TRAP transporter solute-binding subunit [Bacillota bacterium]